MVSSKHKVYDPTENWGQNDGSEEDWEDDYDDEDDRPQQSAQKKKAAKFEVGFGGKLYHQYDDFSEDDDDMEAQYSDIMEEEEQARI